MNGSDLNNLRHSAAHLLAATVLELYPGTYNAIGPAIENGFYQDFDFGDVKISEDNLPKIEKRMRELLTSWDDFQIKEVPAEQAIKDFSHNPYKKELAEEFAKEGKTITETLQGKFLDLCKGNHLKNPKELKHFKLLSIAGAYWRGSEKNKMLTRIYGTAFPTQEELEEHLKMFEEAKKRDHRKIGQEQELFTFSEEIGPGLVIWLPKGTVIKEELEKFGKETEKKRGYLRLSTPHIAKESLFKLSGHLPHYAEDMYPPMISEDGAYYLKPMNCPFMHLAYKSRIHSYKEFPIRYAEYGTVYRYEDSGTLMGLLRVRGQTQNDSHIYCTDRKQALNELIEVMKLHEYYFNLLGIKDFYIELALPDFKKKKNKYFDNPEAWEKSIAILKEAAEKSGVKVVEDVGGAAFYGPKFDFNIKSAIGRKFSITTNQLDFGSGERFKLTYADKDGKEKIVPYIVHRAPLGSDERFIGYLIEHFAGAFPTWLAPVQVKIIPISEKHLEYGQKVLEQLNAAEIRAEIDDRSETMQAKIRDAQLQKTPYMLVIGDKEQQSNSVAVRTRDNNNLGTTLIKEFIEKVSNEIRQKKLTLIS